jgi:hypothetical protein
MTTPPSHARALAETLYVADTADDLRLWVAAIEAHDGETIGMAIKYHEDQAAILRTGLDVNRERPSITMFGGREQAAQWHEQYAAGIRALLSQSPAPDPRDAETRDATLREAINIVDRLTGNEPHEYGGDWNAYVQSRRDAVAGLRAVLSRPATPDPRDAALKLAGEAFETILGSSSYEGDLLGLRDARTALAAIRKVMT